MAGPPVSVRYVAADVRLRMLKVTSTEVLCFFKTLSYCGVYPAVRPGLTVGARPGRTAEGAGSRIREDVIVLDRIEIGSLSTTDVTAVPLRWFTNVTTNGGSPIGSPMVSSAARAANSREERTR